MMVNEKVPKCINQAQSLAITNELKELKKFDTAKFTFSGDELAAMQTKFIESHIFTEANAHLTPSPLHHTSDIIRMTAELRDIIFRFMVSM